MGVKKGDNVEIKKITFQTKEGEPRTAFEVGKIFQDVSVNDISEIIENVDITNENNLSIEERVDKLERQMHILQNK